jgi:thiopeptide-type bacteriocin biosynthesis protein
MTLTMRELLLGEVPELASPVERRQLESARVRALHAGLEVLEAPRDRWRQFNLRPRSGALPELQAGLGRLGDQLLRTGAASNFWFLYKPPGIRLRVETDDPAAAARVTRAVRRWSRDGILEAFQGAVYEPETYLFGGPESMAHVHAQFTADSLAWLALGGTLRQPRLPPSWAVSLVMLRPLFAAFGVVDWEDVDVWDRVVARTGRRLPASVDGPELGEIVRDITDAWSNADGLRRGFPLRVRRVIKRHELASEQVGASWRARGGPESIGARALLALLVIFHWNRAGIPMSRQSILAEALLRRATI